MKKFINKEIINILAFNLLLIVFMIGCKGNPVTIRDLIGYKFIDHHPAWSTDGNTIVYIHEPDINEDTNFNKPGIYLINPDGSNKRLLLYGWQQAPCWSPNNRWIAFQESAEIYKIKVNGDSLLQLTDSWYNSYFPTWSNDGEWIAFESNKESPNGMHFIWKMKKDGSDKVRIAYDSLNGEIEEPNWEDNRIVHLRYFAGSIQNPQISIMDSNGQNFTRLTYDNTQRDLPKLSFDGSKISYTVLGNGQLFQIWVMNSNGTNPRQLTNQYNFYGTIYEQGYTPTWSSDGEKLAYCNSMLNNGRLWIMNKDGSGKKQLTF